MPTPKPQIRSFFATPVCVHFLPIAAEVNAELRPLIVERAQANGTRARGQGWRSAPDFEAWGGNHAETLFRVVQELANTLTATRAGGRLTLDWKSIADLVIALDLVAIRRLGGVLGRGIDHREAGMGVVLPGIRALHHRAVSAVLFPGLVGVDIDGGLAAVRQGLRDRVAISDSERIGGRCRDRGEQNGREAQYNTFHRNPSIGSATAPQHGYGEWLWGHKLVAAKSPASGFFH
jgi:hypothetical protein